MNTLELKLELLKICLEKGLDIEFHKYGVDVRSFNFKTRDWVLYEHHVEDNHLQELIEKVKRFKKQDNENTI